MQIYSAAQKQAGVCTTWTSTAVAEETLDSMTVARSRLRLIWILFGQWRLCNHVKDLLPEMEMLCGTFKKHSLHTCSEHPEHFYCPSITETSHPRSLFKEELTSPFSPLILRFSCWPLSYPSCRSEELRQPPSPSLRYSLFASQ